MSAWSVYMLRCADGTLYTGIATDVQRRIGEHELGNRGAKYLRGRGPLELVFERVIGDRSAAMRVEHCIKQLPKTEKEELQRLPGRIDDLLRGIRDSV